MKLNLRELSFNIPHNPFGNNLENLEKLIIDLDAVRKRAGANNPKFEIAWGKIQNSMKFNLPLADNIEDKMDVRALGAALTEYQEHIKICDDVLERIDAVMKKPSTLFINAVFQFYLNKYKDIENLDSVSLWLRNARKLRNIKEWYDEELISVSGAQWIARYAVDNNIKLEQLRVDLKLNHYQSGKFMQEALKIYYVEQLKVIPLNEPHEFLKEVEKEDVYQIIYSENEFLGHQILKILIERAPEKDIDKSWRNVIMTIAGDPRIPKSHPRYRKWWSHISKELISKVEGWLSLFDLKLFLEALENYAKTEGNDEIRRMYPARRRFLEGLYDLGLIKKTRLYLNNTMKNYLRRTHKKEYLPTFSRVSNGDKSIIYVDLGKAHLVEGSHSCYLWIYKKLDKSATVFQYNIKYETYRGLTSGLNMKMETLGMRARARITHSPQNSSWQNNAVKQLKELGVPVEIKDVLSAEDNRIFVRTRGQWY